MPGQKLDRGLATHLQADAATSMHPDQKKHSGQ